jgi:hypothetical protein
MLNEQNFVNTFQETYLWWRTKVNEDDGMTTGETRKKSETADYELL